MTKIVDSGFIWQDKEACLDHIRKLEVGERISIPQVVDYLLFMNANFSNMAEKRKELAISYYLFAKDYEQFELTSTPAFLLKPKATFEDRVIQYRKMHLETQWYPPVVFAQDVEYVYDGNHFVSVLQETGEKWIYDGNHRASALIETGEKWILGFKGIPKRSTDLSENRLTL